MKNINNSFLKRLFPALTALAVTICLCSCGGTKHSQSIVETKNWVNWTVAFKPGTSVDNMNKTIADIEKTLQTQAKKENPPVTLQFHTIVQNERFVMLNASMLQASNSPKPGSGGPHMPDLKLFTHLKHIENISNSQGSFGG